MEGTVVEQMRHSRFRVELAGGYRILADIAGKIRHQSRHILEGDRVGRLRSPDDLTQGRIVYRLKDSMQARGRR